MSQVVLADQVVLASVCGRRSMALLLSHSPEWVNSTCKLLLRQQFSHRHTLDGSLADLHSCRHILALQAGVCHSSHCLCDILALVGASYVLQQGLPGVLADLS